MKKIYLLFVLLLFDCRKLQVPNYECPVLINVKSEHFQFPLDAVVLSFSNDMNEISEDGIYLLEAENIGKCTPACKGICIKNNCLEGQVDNSFLRDAQSNELSVSNKRKIIPLKIKVEGNKVEIQPLYGTLKPNWYYQLVLTPKIKSIENLPLINQQGKAEAWFLDMFTSDMPYIDEIKHIKSIYPTENSKYLPVNLAWILVGIESKIQEIPAQAFYLKSADNHYIVLNSEFKNGACGKNYETCLLLWMNESLESNTTYEIKVVKSLKDLSGKIIPPWTTFGKFKTDKLKWAWDVKFNDIQTKEITGCNNIKWNTNGISITWIEDEFFEQVKPPILVKTGNIEISIDVSGKIKVIALGNNGNISQSGWLEINSENSNYSSDISITELYPNPIGKEPSQEFLEIYNKTNNIVALDGYRITDDLEKDGDYLDGYELLPYEYAIVVGNKYDFSSEEIYFGSTKVIVLESSLLNAGMSNKGESVYLFNPQNEIESRYNAWFNMSDFEGISIQRDPFNTCDSLSDWYLSNPTPGF